MSKHVRARDGGPVYLPLVHHLEARILSGGTPAGGMLGTEVGLAQQFSISRESARRAIDMLVEQDLVERRPGRGVYVTSKGRRLDSTAGINILLPDLNVSVQPPELARMTMQP